MSSANTAFGSYDAPAMNDKYRFMRALRPFSFGVAIATCLIGITAAWHEGVLLPLNALLVLAGGLLLQAGVNLINDYADLEQPGRNLSGLDRACILRNFRIGLGCFLLATPIGFYLIIDRTLGLAPLFLLGLVGALGYTLNPVNYKARGLAVVLVFWLMGVLMVSGSHVAAGGELDPDIIALSVPVSLLVSLLLLSNELRDYESDRSRGLRTLTVRSGYSRARSFYYLLLGLTLIVTLALWGAELITRPWVLIAAIPLALRPLKYLTRPAAERRPLTPATGQLVMGYGLLFCLSV
ncbi:MAG: prenyltransferase [Oceanospirillaceae bacterium]|nr:prenyltransferase [Oceanospirillaceae bacterium]